MSNLVVFDICPCEISIDFVRQNKLTLFLAVSVGEIVKAIIQMYYLGYNRVSFCSYGTLCGTGAYSSLLDAASECLPKWRD